MFLRFQSFPQQESAEMPKETGVLRVEHAEPSTRFEKEIYDAVGTELQTNIVIPVRFTASFLKQKQQGDTRLLFLGEMETQGL